jgi:hypothetical protein
MKHLKPLQRQAISAYLPNDILVTMQEQIPEVFVNVPEITQLKQALAVWFASVQDT